MDKRTVSLRMIDKSNWYACASLDLKPEQEGLVFPNVWSLAEAHFEPHYCPRAIYRDEEMVGFLMYCPEMDPPDPSLYWLFRFMIAAPYQYQGIGRQAFALALEAIIALGATRIRTMYKPYNATAGNLYRSLGFKDVGILEDGDIELELVVSKKVD